MNSTHMGTAGIEQIKVFIPYILGHIIKLSASSKSENYELFHIFRSSLAVQSL